MEKLDYLIDYLLKENTKLKIERIPTDIIEKQKLYRSLCNIREPRPISAEYLKIENEYLQENLKNRKITNVKDLQTIDEIIQNSNFENNEKICLWQGDITALKIDAIVNAANSQGLGCFIPCHKCIDNQIHSLAGTQLRLECNRIMQGKEYNLPTGEAFITKGYNLPSNYVIHTVGPIVVYKYVTENEKLQLVNSYINCLEIAREKEIRNIAFPCISTGEFHFPKKLASEIAIKTVKDYLEKNNDCFDKIVFNVFTNEDYEIYKNNFEKG